MHTKFPAHTSYQGKVLPRPLVAPFCSLTPAHHSPVWLIDTFQAALPSPFPVAGSNLWSLLWLSQGPSLVLFLLSTFWTYIHPYSWFLAGPSSSPIS